MSRHKYPYRSSLRSIAVSLALNALSPPAFSQITPNGAGTVANSQENQINITGGTQAGANLFHSFRDFNVNSSQVASFLSNPQIQNILARVNGGNPSLINGLLQVTGGNSNLFLINPAGIVFGQGASLNIPASFTATTANQIGFGNNLFNAVGDNNFSALTGNPDRFLFTTTQAGSIVNAGNLAVGNGQNISLIAGNTINTGRLTAPGGEIQVLAVPGTNRVRLSQPGQVLSLEIVPPVDGTLRAVDLPALLTGHDLPGIQVNPSGQVQVAGTNLPNQQGLAIASGAIDVSSNTGNGGTVQILGDRVAALNSRINANGATGGGTVRLGGEYLGGRDTGIAPAMRFNSQRTLVDRNSLIRANATVTGDGGRVIVWADRDTGYFGRITGRGATGRGAFVEVSGRENLAFDGRVEIPGANGLFGSLLLDPTNITIVAAGPAADDGQIGALDGLISSGDSPANMTISAGALAGIAATTAIDITASNDISFDPGVVVNLTGSATPAPVTLRAGGTISAGTGALLNTNGRNLTLIANAINAPNLNLQTFNNGFASSGSIDIIAANGNLNLGNLNTANNLSNFNSNFLRLSAPNGSITTNNTVTAPNIGFTGGSITITAQGNITSANSIGSQGGAINVDSDQGNISTNITQSAVNNGNGGNITFRASQGSITTTNQINASVPVGNGSSGNINLTAQDNISITGTLLANVANGNGNGGNITLRANQGSITANQITGAVLSGTGQGGNLNLTAQGNIFITNGSNLNAGTNTGNGGNITLRSIQGSIVTGTTNLIRTDVGAFGSGGSINLSAQGDISTGVLQTGTPSGNGGSISLFAQGNIAANQLNSISGNAGSGGAIDINARNLVRINTTATSPGCPTVFSICSFNFSGGESGAITIRYGGGATIPLTVGDASINGTSGGINASTTGGPGSNRILGLQIFTPPITIGTKITLISTAPDPFPVGLIPFLLPPTPPPTPVPVVVGTPPAPEPVVESPLPAPSPSPSPLPTPPPIPAPLPIPLPIPSPSPIPNPLPIPDPPLRTTLQGVNTNPQLPAIAVEPLSGSLSLVTNPSTTEISARLEGLEAAFQSEFQEYLDITSDLNSPQTLPATQNLLNQVTEQTDGVTPALVYVFFAPQDGTNDFSNERNRNLAAQTNRAARDSDRLEVILITGRGSPVRVQFPETTRRQVIEVADNFRSEVTNFRSSRGFLIPAQQMYQWIIAPLEAELQKQGINNLVFLLDGGLRSIPLAAMHDGKGFIVERYSVGLMPSLNLTQPSYNPLQGAQVLAMGATTFTSSGLSPLPAVSVELNTISQIWQGAEFLNDRFTLNNLIQQRQNRPFRIIHLATHAVFSPGNRSNSYIQLWDRKLSLDQLEQLDLGNPPVDLLVLSACQTALGDRDAELGFASLAINAGVRTALASLWQVNDAATLGLMTKFYQQLQVTTTKSEALRQAQLAMIRGEVRLEDGNLVTASEVIPLTDELRSLGDRRLSHPYYWSAFTMVGNPW